VRRFFLSKRDVKKLVEELRSLGFKEELKQVEKALFKDMEVFLVEGKPLCFRKEGRLFPSLHFAERFELKKIKVDMGAVPHLLKGADVMAPGIVEMTELKEGEIVLVVDEKYGKPIVVGASLISGQKPEKGKVVANVHRVGDEVWKMKF
jgi:PUA domain protein